MVAVPSEELVTPRLPRSRDGLAWRWASLLLGAMVAVPLLVIFSGWSHVEGEVWRHLADTLLADLVRNTVVLVVGVGLGVFLLGVSLAWLTVMYDFPGRRVFDWALMLPLAIPAYVLAFVMIGLLDFSGPVQGVLRAAFGSRGYWFPEIRSTGGVIAVMVMALYPYVYMLARTAFMSQGRSTLEAARVMGMHPWNAFLRVSLPMARPAIAAGVALALMETLADFGAVSVFNYDTFTTAIYKAWFGLFNLDAAAQLASVLLLFVAVALTIERRTRGRARYHGSGRVAVQHRQRLTGTAAWGATVAAGTVLTLAFAVPVGQLLVWAWQVVGQDLDARYLEMLAHTLALGGVAAVITVAAAFVLSYTRRYHPAAASNAAVRLGTLGYALPGSVLAVGVMLSFTWIDNRIEAVTSAWLGVSAPLVLSGTLAGLLLAYVVRFMAVSFGPVDSGLERIKPSIRDAARSLGASRARILWRVFLPMLRPGLLTAVLLVFVEVMKEMPATLLLRPFGWDTFAVRVFEMTSEGEWERAALPAVTLVLVGLIPVILLVRRSGRGR